MKPRMLMVWIAAAAVIWNVAAVDAQPQRGHRRGHRFEDRLHALELTAEQKGKVKALHLAQAKQMAQLRADHQIARLELQNLLGQADPKASDVKSRVAAVNKAQGKILETRVNLQVNLNKILTSEQRGKLKEMEQRRPGREHQGRQRRGGRRGRPGFHRPGPAPPVPQN